MYIEEMSFYDVNQLRAKLPTEVVAMYAVDEDEADRNEIDARVCHEHFDFGVPCASEQFGQLWAARYGWEIEEGWWWHETVADYPVPYPVPVVYKARVEQRHGPFHTERACLVHALTWQHILVNGQLKGTPYREVE